MQIAKYAINKCTRDNHPLSNLQLQNILYYIQKELLQRGMPGFTEEIQAWQFGPAVPEVYRQYCGFGSLPIAVHYAIDIAPKYREVIDPIIEKKRRLQPWDIVRDIHQKGKAWSLVYKYGAGNYSVIPKSLIQIAG